MSDTSTAEAQKNLARLVLIAACLATGVVGYNTTAASTALPAIKSTFDMNAEMLQWAMNSYLLASAVLVGVMGRLSDLFGKVRVFLAALCIFALGSLSIVLSSESWLFYVGRVFQGIGAATIFATSVALLTVVSPEDRRASALGLWAAMIALGIGVGPVLGGLITDFVEWRVIFVLDLILLAVAIALALRIKMLGGITEAEHSGERIDYLGAGLLIMTLASLVFALTHGHRAGWLSPEILGLFATTVIGGAVFYWAERRASAPLVKFQFFRHPHFLASTFGIFVATFALWGLIYNYNIFVQTPDAMGQTAVQAGLTLLPVSAAMFICSVFLPSRLEKYSLHWPVTLGMLCLALAAWLLHMVGNNSPYSQIWWKLLIYGLGLGLTIPLLSRLGLRVIPEADSGQGSGIINTCLYFGGSIGIAASGVVTAYVRHKAIVEVAGELNVPDGEVQRLARELAHGSISEVRSALASLDPEVAQKAQSVLIDIADDGFNSVMLLLMIVMIIGAVLCFLLGRGPVLRENK